MRISFVKITGLYPICALLLLAALEGALSPSADAYCGYCHCTGYWDYIPDANGGICISSGCYFICTGGASLVAWNPELTGIEVSDNVPSVVVAIYRNSPADRAGMRVGDVILEINGKSAPYSCSANEGAAAEEYLIKRGTRKMKMAVPRISASEMVLRATQTHFTEVGLKNSQRLLSFSPYISGAILRKTSHGFEIENIIPGTPADAAGLKKDSRVLAIRDALTNEPSNAGEGADYRAEVVFVVQSGGITTTKTLQLRGLSEVLASTLSSRTPSSLTASLNVGE